MEGVKMQGIIFVRIYHESIVHVQIFRQIQTMNHVKCSIDTYDVALG